MVLEKVFWVTSIIFTTIASVFFILATIMILVSYKKIGAILENIKAISQKTKEAAENLTISSIVYKLIKLFRRKE